MAVLETYYCIKSTTEIAKLAVEYRKVQELDKLTSEVKRQEIISESILSYSRLIRGGIETLMHMYFKSAYENLQFALNASEQNRREYIIQARNRFVDAISVERNENLILSYIGLSLCQMLTGDDANGSQTIQKIKNVCCTLPDDYETLCSMFPYEEDWVLFFFRYTMLTALSNFSVFGDRSSAKKCFNEAFTDLPRYYGLTSHWRYSEDLSENNIISIAKDCHMDTCMAEMAQKQYAYFKRRCKALSGVSLINSEEFCKADKMGLKVIFREDFDGFKSSVISLFGI